MSDFMITEDSSEVNESDLFYAIKEDDTSSMQYFVDKKVNVNHLFFGVASSKSSYSLLHLCCQYGSFGCCEILLKAGADVNATDRNGQTPLMYAAITGWKNITELLLQYGTDTKIKDISGSTVIHRAANCDDPSIIEAFVKHKDDINESDRMGRTPLWLAASSDVSVAVVSTILNSVQEETINVCDSRKKWNPLQATIMASNCDLYKKAFLLIQNGCNIYHIDIRMFTPMMNLMQRWYESEVKGKLVKKTEKELMDIFYLLLNNGYNINFHTAGTRVFDHDGNVLHLAAKLGLQRFVPMLIQNGINVEQINNKGQTPLLIAAHHKRLEIAKLLLQNGANINATAYFLFHRLQNKVIFGSSFRLALESDALELAYFLIDAGYDLHLESYLLDEIDVPDILLQNTQLFEYFRQVQKREQYQKPKNLFLLCCQLIRYTLGSKLQVNTKQLPLPQFTQDVLCYKRLVL